MERVILHCDMNGFFASVELLDYPELKNVPMAVCGNPENRHGIILAKNEHAKKFGIKTAETLWQARKKCPSLQCVPPHMEKYKRYSKLINEIYYRFTNMVEPFSIDESWLDVTRSIKLFGNGENIANEIRETVKKELGLTLSAGVSYNKIFAKMGSEYKKPDATTVISKDNFKKILWPMNVGEMFTVGQISSERLIAAGIKTIGQLAEAKREFLVALLGKHGGIIHDYANGLDTSPVCDFYEREKIQSVGNGITFKRNLVGESDIKMALTGLSDKVASRLRKYQIKACGVKIDIKNPDFQSISRQKQLETPTNLSIDLVKAGLEIIKRSWDVKKPIRLLTVTAIGLCDENESQQISIFQTDLDKNEKEESVERTIDNIRQKFGDSSILFGSLVDNSIGISPNLHIEKE